MQVAGTGSAPTSESTQSTLPLRNTLLRSSEIWVCSFTLWKLPRDCPL